MLRYPSNRSQHREWANSGHFRATACRRPRGVDRPACRTTDSSSAPSRRSGSTSARWAPVKEAPQGGLLMAAFVFPLEGLAAVLAFLARDTLAATVLGLFTTSWLALGLVLITATPGAISVTEGFFLLGFTGAVAVLGFLATSGKP